MDIPGLLSSARKSLPRCDSLVFGDGDQGTVLAGISRDEAARQEHHDALLESVTGLLSLLPDAQEVGAVAMLLTPDETQVGVTLDEGEVIAGRFGIEAADVALDGLQDLAQQITSGSEDV